MDKLLIDAIKIFHTAGSFSLLIAIFDMINFDDEAEEKYFYQMTFKLFGGLIANSVAFAISTI